MDKKILVKFEVDAGSLEKAITAVKQLRDAAGGAIAGGGGGGGQSSGVAGQGGGGIFNVSSQDSTATQREGGVAGAMIGSQGGILPRLTNIFGMQASGIKSVMKSAEGSIKDFVENSDRELRRLLTTVDSLSTKLRGMSIGGGGGRGGGTAPAPTASHSTTDGQAETGLPSEDRKGLNWQQRGANRAALGALGGLVGYTGVPTNIMSAATGSQWLMAASPVFAGVGATGMGLTAGIATGNWLVQQNQTVVKGNLEADIASAGLQAKEQARIGQTLGGLQMSMRGGNVALSSAYLRANKQGNPENVELNRIRNTAIKRVQLLAQDSGFFGTIDVPGLGPVEADSTLTGAAKAIATKAGMIDWTQNRSDMGAADDPRARAFEVGLKRISGDVVQQQAEYYQNLTQADMYKSYVQNRTYSEAGSRRAFARATGAGTGMTRIPGQVDAGGQPLFAPAWMALQARTTKWSEGEVAGIIGQFSQTAGRGLMGAGERYLGAQSGGLTNVAQLFGVGAQFGGGGRAGGAAFVEAVQQGIGKRGVDVTAGVQVSSLAAQAMVSGNFVGMEGKALAQGLLSVTQTDTPGGDMRMARILQSGMGAYGRQLAGEVDPLQKGINVLAANYATAGMSHYARQRLMKVTPEAMIEMMRTGKVSGELQDVGVGIDNLKSYTAFQSKYAFTRLIGKEMAGTRMGEAVAGYQSAGGLAEYLRQKTGGITDPKKRREIVQEQLRILGGARQLSLGGNLEENIGALTTEIAQYKDLAPSIRGAGRAGDVVGKGTDLTAQADALQKQVIDEMKERQKWGAGMLSDIKNMGLAIDTVRKEADTVTPALESLTRAGWAAAMALGTIGKDIKAADLDKLLTAVEARSKGATAPKQQGLPPGGGVTKPKPFNVNDLDIFE